MILDYQNSAIEELKSMADADRHIVLLSGQVGCGKRYLSKQYSKYLNISDYYQLDTSVAKLRDSLDVLNTISTKTVVCLPNIDTLSNIISNTLLKFLEDYPKNVYVVLTCNDISHVLDTILSRCVIVNVSIPKDEDILSYAKVKYPDRYTDVISEPIWSIVTNLSDVDTVCELSRDQIAYIYSLKKKLIDPNTAVSNISWNLTHFEDNSSTDIKFVLKYILNTISYESIKLDIISALDDIDRNIIPVHVIINNLIMKIKYG